MKVKHQTKRCVRCQKSARLWSGFVAQRDGRPVLAGWCGKTCSRAWFGYHGSYRASFGRERV
jgi:hypothetical protein